MASLMRGERLMQGNALEKDELLLESDISIPLDNDPAAFEDMPEPASGIVPSPLVRAATVLVALAGAAWVGFLFWRLAERNFALPATDQIPAAAANACLPLILLGILHALILRSSPGEAHRFARLAALLRKESGALDMRLAIVNQQLDTARATMREQAALLEQYGGSASANLEATARTLSHHASTSAQQAEVIERAGLSLAHQFAQLIDAMPAVQERAERVSDALTTGSAALTDKVDRLEARLEALAKLLEDVRGRTTGATQSMTAQLLQIQDATRSASDEVTGMAELSASRIATAADQARTVLDETGLTLDMRMADLNVLVEQSRSALDNIGGAAVTAYGQTIAAIEQRLRHLSALLDEQAVAIGHIGDDTGHQVDRLAGRLAEVEAQGLSGAQNLSHALDTLAGRAVQLGEALQSGSKAAEAMIARSESLLLALDASVRELDEGHPAALSRFDGRVDQSRRLVGSLTPEVERLEAIAASIFGQAKDAEELFGDQTHKLGEWLRMGESSLAACHDRAAELSRALGKADSEAQRLSDSAGPQLVATLMRVREAADQAGERARQALARAVSDAAGQLGEASEKALTERLGESFQARMDEIGTVADRAVKAAHTASDRLMRQLITIADTTASIEQRIAEAEKAAEQRDRESFSRRSAMLIEALNSAAIDMTRVLSTEVSDSNWGAYLKGDRGVFTRRAVRLLDNGETRSVIDLYEGDESFREGVNRYIHDFEAMLRNVLSTRDGSALGVTLLSSDMGKLYVALAQAIDRLRN